MPINHFSRNHDEVLLPMRKDDGGRTALLRNLRQNVRRETLPAAARESARRGSLLEMWQPRTLDATAKNSREPPAFGIARPAGAWSLALLCVPQPHCGGR